jgi:hypothetical protein
MPDALGRPNRIINTRIAFAILCCLLAAVPFLVVKFPPITDLAQHAAQIRLFGEALGQPDSPYKIQWMTPYSLVYTVLGAAWPIVGSMNAGRIGMLIVALLWIVVLHLLASRLKRPPLAAALASLLFFGHILYWGFYQFAFGWTLFMGWVLLTQVNFKSRFREAAAFFLSSAVLYFAHVLWFFVAVGWLAAQHILLKPSWQRTAARLAGALPFIILAVLWYPSLAEYGFRSKTVYSTVLFQRLAPAFLVDASFGGLRGSVEFIFFGLLIAWLFFGFWQNRREVRLGLNRELFFFSLFLLLLAFVLPDLYTNTTRFWQRWVPPALVFLLLGFPAPRIRKTILTAFVAVAAVSFFLVTSLNWVAFEKSEMSGLEESLSALPQAPRVVGLSFIKDSAIVRGRPFIQVFAYSQVLRGGELNFSFADFGPSLVVYRRRRHIPWTSGLEWFPERAKKGDLLFFDYALINAAEKMHETIASEAYLKPVTSQGRWRCYRVLPPQNP